MKRATLPTVSILDQSNITTFTSIDETVFIAYILAGDEALKSTFTELATRHHDKYTFGIATQTAASMTLPSIVCHQWREEEEKVFSTQASIDALEKFIEEATAPTIGEFTRRNEMKYMKVRTHPHSGYRQHTNIYLKAGKSLVYYFARTEDERNEYKALLKPLAKKYKEYLSFVTVDAVEYEHMIPALGLQDGSLPALAVFNPMYGQAFPYDQGRKIKPEAVESFVLDIVQGKVQPYGSVAAGPHTEL
jgi:protein disulfide-isomerase A1